MSAVRKQNQHKKHQDILKKYIYIFSHGTQLRPRLEAFQNIWLLRVTNNTDNEISLTLPGLAKRGTVASDKHCVQF